MMQDFSMHVLDIVQNSIRAEAKHITVAIVEKPSENLFSFFVSDDGKGMDADFLEKIRDPFQTSRTTRRVGLGIPMLDMTASLCGGALEIESAPRKGTTLMASMRHDSIDRPPLGNIAEAVYLLVVSNPALCIRFTHSYEEKSFSFDTEEIRAVLGEVPFSEPSVAMWIRDSLAEGENELKKL